MIQLGGYAAFEAPPFRLLAGGFRNASPYRAAHRREVRRAARHPVVEQAQAGVNARAHHAHSLGYARALRIIAARSLVLDDPGIVLPVTLARGSDHADDRDRDHAHDHGQDHDAEHDIALAPLASVHRSHRYEACIAHRPFRTQKAPMRVLSLAFLAFALPAWVEVDESQIDDAVGSRPAPNARAPT